MGKRNRVVLAVCLVIGCADLDRDVDPEYEDESEVDEMPEAVELDPVFELDGVLLVGAGTQLRVCGASSLNQRSGPGTAHAILRAMPEDEVVTVIESSAGWLRVDWDGLVGWSFGKYLCGLAPPTTSASESVDSPNAGRLRKAAAITPHPGYVIANTGRNATWGTAETVYWIRRAFDAVDADAARPQVRDISVQVGGEPSGPWPHASHQSGRDVDLTYPRHSCSATTGCPLQDVTSSSLDVATTWALLEVWLTNNVARRIFIDSSLHAVLRDRARARGHSAATVAKWFGPIIMHVANHKNHLHVRFQCPADDDECTN